MARGSKGKPNANNKKRASASSGRGARPSASSASLAGRALKWVVILGLVAGLLAASGVAGIFYYYGRDLPTMLKREDFRPPQLSRIYASDGALIAELANPGQGGKRTVVPMEQLPKEVRYAFMAAEDADFLTHEGIDYLGMVRAFYNALFHDTGMKGTSTITQQVVKNLILTPERSLARKVKEIILSRELEKNLTKEDILWMYLNEVYMGHGVNGVEEASRLYFGKSAKDLKLAEAALLAGINQSPERLSPYKYPERALKRRAFVLRQLWEKGFVEEAAYREADAAPLKLTRLREREPNIGAAPHFVEHVRKQLIARYGEEVVYTGGLRVYTTLDIKRQRGAEQAVIDGMADYDTRQGYYRPRRKLKDAEIDKFAKGKRVGDKLIAREVYEAVVTRAEGDEIEVRIGDKKATLLAEPRERILAGDKKAKVIADVIQRGHVLRVVSAGEGPDGALQVHYEPGPEVGALLVEPRTRDVVALVGAYHASNQYNHVTQAARQTGSTFKPLVYAAALEAGKITPATVVIDQPEVFKIEGGKTYAPKNSDNQFRGPIRIREGIGASRNVVAVHVLVKLIGVDAAAAFAKKVGIESELTKNATMVMGSSSLKMTEIVNSYATFASGGELAPLRFITRVERVTGEKEVFERRAEQVIAPEVAYLITDLMLAVTQGYTNSEGKRQGGTASSVNKLGMPIAGKTGTTNDAKDAWFIGYTPYYVGGVWVGFTQPAPLGRNEYGGKVSAPIWLGMMRVAHEGLKPRKFEPPAVGVTTAVIDPRSGLLSRGEGIEEVFLTGTTPTEYAPDEGQQGVQDFLLEQVQ